MNTKPVGLSVAVPPASGIVGVRTTGIYCRPDCRPGRDPLPKNKVMFADTAEARSAGYRACKKCKPDGPATSPPETLRYAVGPGPIGPLVIAKTGRGIASLYVLDGDDPTPGLDRLRDRFPGSPLVEDVRALAPAFALVDDCVRRGRSCEGVALDLRGTPFQVRVWGALTQIPWGQTTTYGALARSLGLPTGAARAVGTACGTNPVSLIVPCHRVLHSGGGLGGYYWGLDRKAVLLDIERTNSVAVAV